MNEMSRGKPGPNGGMLSQYKLHSLTVGLLVSVRIDGTGATLAEIPH